MTSFWIDEQRFEMAMPLGATLANFLLSVGFELPPGQALFHGRRRLWLEGELVHRFEGARLRTSTTPATEQEVPALTLSEILTLRA